MSAPQVYRAIHAISAELARAGIAKLHRNERDDYLYRSIDDVLNRLSPLLAGTSSASSRVSWNGAPPSTLEMQISC